MCNRFKSLKVDKNRGHDEVVPKASEVRYDHASAYQSAYEKRNVHFKPMHGRSFKSRKRKFQLKLEV